MIPYRKLYIEPAIEKKRPCFLFHSWQAKLKQGLEEEAVRFADNRWYVTIDLYEDYNLVCSTCGKERKMPNSSVYLMLAVEDVKRRFLHKERISIEYK